MRLTNVVAVMLAIAPTSAWARNIVISNDDGLTSNVKALYDALKAQGHDVIVSVPCQNQSGMGAAIKFMRPLGPLAEGCRNGAAAPGDPGAGPMTRRGFERDWFYVDGTPVMATLYGIDVAAQKRWGRAPDLVLSGPNEGQNIGSVVVTSGTVSNAQYAAGRNIPAIALSAGLGTTDDNGLAHPNSAIVAKLAVDLIRTLDRNAGQGPLLPAGAPLNVNFPDRLEGAKWRATRIGTYNAFDIRFVEDISNSRLARAMGSAQQHLPGLDIVQNEREPRPDQLRDESVVNRKDISVSVMQVGYDRPSQHEKWLSSRLAGLLER